MFKLHGLVVLVLACLCGHFATAQMADIITPPRAVNVSANTVAVFTCTAVCNSIIWRGNGQQIDELEGEVVITIPVLNNTLNIRMSTLELTVSSTDDASNITCTAISDSPLTLIESDPVLLLVQGLLDSVNDLTVDSINATAVRISWNPPVSLEGVPILKYTVTITNATSGDDIIETVNTTMLYYVFSIDSPDPDSEFNVTVIPINMVGAGEVSLDFKFLVQEVIKSTTVSAPSSTVTTVTSIAVTTSNTLTPPTEPIIPSNFPVTVVIAVVVVVILALLIASVSIVVIIFIIVKTKSKKVVQTDYTATSNPIFPTQTVAFDGGEEEGESPSHRLLPHTFLKATTSGPKAYPNQVFLWQEGHDPNNRRCASLTNIVFRGKMGNGFRNQENGNTEDQRQLLLSDDGEEDLNT